MPREHRLRLLAAFAAIYLIWGSTYLAIRYAVATIPPYLMAGTRFGSAGLILLALARARGAAWPTRHQWGVAFVSGTLLLAGGIGSVSWAERRVPSGLAALVAGAVPLVTEVVDWLRPGGSPPDGITTVGLLAGFAGSNGAPARPRAAPWRTAAPSASHLEPGCRARQIRRTGAP